MKRNLPIQLGLLTMVSMFAFSSYAQEGDKNVKQKITDEKGNTSLITFHEKSSYKSSDFEQVFKDQLKLKSNSSFQKTTSETDLKGFVHEKFQLYHKGIKVEFATYTLHSKNGILVSMSGETYALENTNTIPTLSKQQAFAKALNQIDAKSYLWDNPTEAAAFNYTKPAGELVLLPVSNDDVVTLKLAYKFDIYATNPVSRGDLYIDAVTGTALFYNATIKHLGEFSNGISSSKTENLLTQKTPC